MKIFIQHDMFIKANRVKYKFLIIPIIVIIINFVITLLNEDSNSGLGSIIALLFYFFILYTFRFKKVFSEPDEQIAFAPVNGLIANIVEKETGTILTIDKQFFAPCELVTSTNNDIINSLDTDSSQVSWKVEGPNKYIFIDETIEHQAAMIGILPGNAVCEIFIPNEYEIKIDKGTKVEAGFTELAILKN